MSAESLNVFIAFCEECDWESEETYDNRWLADKASEKHNESHHNNEITREEWLEYMDELVERINEYK